jgi:hypothetical protein
VERMGTGIADLDLILGGGLPLVDTPWTLRGHRNDGTSPAPKTEPARKQ